MKNLRHSLLFILFFCFVDLSSQSGVMYAKWKNNASGAYSFDTDDYNTSFYSDMSFIAKIIDSLKLKITFAFQSYQSGMVREHGIKDANTKFVGCEFACHSWDHEPGLPNTYYLEADSAQSFINAMIPWQKCLIFVFPGGGTYVKSDFNNYIKTRSYIGSNGGGVSNPMPHNLSDPFNYSMTYSGTPTASWLNGMVDNAISGEKWSVSGTHNIGVLTSWGPLSATEFRNHMIYCRQKIDAGQLWMAPIQNVLKYMMEREKFPLSILTENDTMMVLHIDTQTNEINPSEFINNQHYDEPLTITGSTKYGTAFQFDANPWYGNITIKYDASSVLSIKQTKGDIMPSPTVSVDKSYEEITYSSNTITVNVSGSNATHIYTENQWIQLDKDSINGNAVVTLSIDKNMKNKDRYGCVFFTNNGQDIKKLIIKQAKNPNYLTLYTDTLKLKYNAVTASFGITTNHSWQISSSALWAVPNFTSGTNTTTLKLTITPNPDTTIREAWIKIITSEGFSDSVLVIQDKGVPAQVTNQQIKQELKVFPNPCIDKIEIQFMEEIQQVKIFSCMGIEVKNMKSSCSSMSIDVSELPSGSYILQVIGVNGMVANKRINKFE